MFTVLIIAVFVLGYLSIALEGVTRINKAAVALLMCVVCWGLYAIGHYAPSSEVLNESVLRNLGETGTTLFFLMGAMAVVEIVDRYQGFSFVQKLLRSKSKKALLWKIGFMTFLLSAVLDNLTTSIVMVMIMRKLVAERTDRLWLASIIVIAANAGGAFSPIGDVTTIMLWNGGMITGGGVISHVIVPSLMAFLVPMAIVHTRLKGELVPLDAQLTQDEEEEYTITAFQRDVVFVLGVGGLCSVPVFHSLTGLPPFVGILSVFGLLWFITEIMYFRKDPQEESPMRVTRLLPKIDLATIFFFLGNLMTVAVLAEEGVLADLGGWLQHTIGNSYLVTGIIGVVSSIVDNVPLVACAMKMYPICQAGADFCVDGQFWQLLSFCAGTGGSMLIIGSAAGVVVMGLEKISFGWYLKRITPIAFAGYLCGILSYWLLHSFL